MKDDWIAENVGSEAHCFFRANNKSHLRQFIAGRVALQAGPARKWSWFAYLVTF